MSADDILFGNIAGVASAATQVTPSGKSFNFITRAQYDNLVDNGEDLEWDVSAGHGDDMVLEDDSGNIYHAIVETDGRLEDGEHNYACMDDFLVYRSVDFPAEVARTVADDVIKCIPGGHFFLVIDDYDTTEF